MNGLLSLSLVLVAFVKLRMATIRFVMSACLLAYLSVCLSACMGQLGSNWTDFHKVWTFKYSSIICSGI